MNLIGNGDTAPPTAADAAGVTGDHTVQISGGSNVILSGVLIQDPTGNGLLALNLGGINRLNNNTRISDLDASAGHGIYFNNTNTNMTLFQLDDVEMGQQCRHRYEFFLRQYRHLEHAAGCEELAVRESRDASDHGRGRRQPPRPDAGKHHHRKHVSERDGVRRQQRRRDNVGILVNNGATHTSLVDGNTSATSPKTARSRTRALSARRTTAA